jgi:hypothetical protein
LPAGRREMRVAAVPGHGGQLGQRGRQRACRRQQQQLLLGTSRAAGLCTLLTNYAACLHGSAPCRTATPVHIVTEG